MRRLTPRRFRARLALWYGGLFFVAGSILLGTTYALVANSIPSGGRPEYLNHQARVKAIETCRLRAAAGDRAGKPLAGTPVAQRAKCEQILGLGARLGVASQRDTTLRNLLEYSLLALLALTVLSGGLGWLMASRALRPVRAITDMARRASERHLGERVGLKGPEDELKELADTFDEMLERLDAAFGAQQRFVANASHELRTPLTVMRTAVDVTLAKPEPTVEQLTAMAERIRRAVDQAESLIEALLTLAASEQHLEPTVTEAVDLATASEDALDTYTGRFTATGLRVVVDLAPAPVSGDRRLLERMVANLVENAVKYNDPGGRIRLVTATDSSRSVVEVSNTGPSVAPAILARLFEPFQRAAERTNGAGPDGVGLGLSIVRSIAELHGGAARAVANPTGGLTVTVELPRRTDPPAGVAAFAEPRTPVAAPAGSGDVGSSPPTAQLTGQATG